MLELGTPVQYVKGIGPRLAEVLAGKGIHTVDDLLHYLLSATKIASIPEAFPSFVQEKWRP